MRGRFRNEKWSVKKAGALPQREPGLYKKWGAAATRKWQYKQQGRCRNKNRARSEEHTSELQSHSDLVCRLLLEKKKKKIKKHLMTAHIYNSSS